MSLPFFPMYPSDFEADTSHLTLEEDGAYNRLLRLMWMTNGCSLPDDDAWIARRMRVDIETFDRVIRGLLDEFFVRSNNRVSNARLTSIFDESSAAHKRRVDAGSRGGKSKPLKTKDFTVSKAEAKPKQPQPQPQPYKEVIDTNVSISDTQTELIPSEPAKPKAKRAAPKIPFPVDWVLPDDWRADAIQRGMRPEMVDLEAKDFQSYHTEGGEKRPGWRRSWTTWVKNHTRDEAKNDTRSYNQKSNNGSGDTSRRAHAAAISGKNAQYFGTGFQEPIDITPTRVQSIDCGKQS